MIRAGAVSSSSWTSLRRRQAPRMLCGRGFPGGQGVSTTSSPATHSTLSFLTDALFRRPLQLTVSPPVARRCASGMVKPAPGGQLTPWKLMASST